MNEEARNAIIQSLGEWGVRVNASAQHERFYNQCIRQVDHCLSNTPIATRSQVDQHELPNDMHDAVRHVYRKSILMYKDTDKIDEMEEDELVHFISIDDNLEARCSTEKQKMEVAEFPPYFFRSQKKTFEKKRAFEKFSVTDLDPFQRFAPREESVKKP